jgi:dTDP-4-dehydrorhamnose 3,5-epimerase
VIVTELPVAGAFLIETQRVEDARGFFARTFCAREFAERGLETRFVQSGLSFNEVQGTLRGMHFQRAPHEEVKLVRCTAGAILDVVLDLRRDSPTYLQHAALQLTPGNLAALYVPQGCAHGFQTLVDASEVSYQISAFWEASAGGGARFDDPAFGIRWPLPVARIAERDLTYPDWRP